MRLWPTPTASDHRGAQTVAACKRWRSRGRNLPEAVVLAVKREHSVRLALMEYVYVTMNSEGVLTEHEEVPLDVPEPTVVAQHGKEGETLVSTAFTPLCLKSETGLPMPFETIIVRGHKSVVVGSYPSLDEAFAAHDQAVQRSF